MKIEDANPKAAVEYIPKHERGLISSSNDHFIFVKFEDQLMKLGWDETTSQACRPEDLRIL